MARLIRDWLTEYKSLSEANTKQYATTVFANQLLIRSLYELFHKETDSSEVIDPVVHQLFEFYRSPHAQLKRFTLQFVPTLLKVYLLACSRNEKKTVNSIETTLLGIYNLEVVNEDGSPKIETYRIPSLGMASIYHEAAGIMLGSALTESALSSYDSEHKKIQYGPFPQVERVTAKNRMSVMTYVLRCYNADIANFPQMSLESVCSLATTLCMNGFENLRPDPKNKSKNNKPIPRVTLNSSLLIELLNSVYFVMFNGFPNSGTQALEDVHFRACHELYSDVTLVTNSIRNALSHNPLGTAKDGPMGISVASPTSHSSAASHSNKMAITNASFRIKKLPDDITVEDTDGMVNGDDGAEKKADDKVKTIDQITRPLKSVLKMGEKLRKDKDTKDVKRDNKDKDITPQPSPHRKPQPDLEMTQGVNLSNKSSKNYDSMELKKIVEQSEPSSTRTSVDLSSTRSSLEPPIPVHLSLSSSSRKSESMYTCSESSLPTVNQKNRNRLSSENINPHSVNTEV